MIEPEAYNQKIGNMVSADFLDRPKQCFIVQLSFLVILVQTNVPPLIDVNVGDFLWGGFERNLEIV